MPRHPRLTLRTLAPARTRLVGPAAIMFTTGLMAATAAAGDATFGGFELAGTHLSKRFMATGDFDGDGHVDIASVAGWGSSAGAGVTVVLGHGDGTFGPPATYASGPAGTACADVGAGDFTGDGILDLVVANDDPTVSILTGQGDGSFVESEVLALSSEVPSVEPFRWIEVADLDGDGDLEFTGLPRTGPPFIITWNNDGAGALTRFGPFLLLGINPAISMTLADLNGDGLPDLAAGISGPSISPELRIRLNSGGFFSGFDQALVLDFGLSNLFAADLDADGNVDLAGSPGGSQVQYCLGNGDGTVQASQILSTGGSFATVAAAGDLDGDGDDDLVFADLSVVPNAVNVFLQAGGPLPEPAGSSDMAGPALAIELADLNGDGRLDLITGPTGSAPDQVGSALLNGTPPAPSTPEDLDQDGTVGLGDLLIVLAAWGPCEACGADLDEDGQVGLGDLLAVLAEWGPVG